MQRLIKPALVLGAVIAAAGALGACSDGGGGGGDVVVPPPDPVPPMGAARFGFGFGLAFAVAANTDPRDPVSTDIIPISLTADPLDVMSPGG